MFGFNKFLKSTGENVVKLKHKVEELKKKQQEIYEKSIPEPHKPKLEKHESILIEFSLLSVTKATLVVIGLVILTQFLSEISEILLIFFIAYLFSAALHPTVKSLERYRIPKAVSIILIYILLLLLLGFFITQLVPLIAIQIIELARNLSQIVSSIDTTGTNSDNFIVQQIKPFIDSFAKDINKDLIINEAKQYLESIGTQLQSFAGNTFAVIKTVFQGLLNFVLVLILTFFLTIEEKGVNNFFISLFPSKHGQYIIEKIETVKQKVGFWLRGIVTMMVIMFSLTLTGLLILGVDYALTLAMMIGIAELIPVVGVILSSIAAILVAFNQSPWLGVWVLGLYILLQQLEGHIIVPLVMRKAVGLSPIVIILSMLVGFTTLGILGMIIAIPVATSLSIFVIDYTGKEK